MRPQTVRTVLQTLGSYHSDPKLNSAGDWGSASCPLAPWTHGGGRDKNPSLMVSVEPGISSVKCMSCGHSGGMLSLVNEVARYGGITNETLDELRYLILLEETKHYIMLEREGLRPEIPASFVDHLDNWHPYWKERGITRSEARSWRLGYDPEGKRALIPFFDFEGILRGVVGRDITGFGVPKYKIMPSGFDRANYLFGEHRITGREKRIFLVEGYLDAITASRYVPDDIGVVALGTAIPSKDQIRRLALIADEEIIVGLDNDSTGQLGIAKLQRNLARRTRKRVSTPHIRSERGLEECRPGRHLPRQNRPISSFLSLRTKRGGEIEHQGTLSTPPQGPPRSLARTPRKPVPEHFAAWSGTLARYPWPDGRTPTHVPQGTMGLR